MTPEQQPAFRFPVCYEEEGQFLLPTQNDVETCVLPVRELNNIDKTVLIKVDIDGNSFDDIVKYDSGIDNFLNDMKNGNMTIKEWTAPRWAGIGDVAFFMQSETTVKTLAKHRKKLYDMGKTNMSYKEFLHLLPSLCRIKAKGSVGEMHDWMIYPEETVRSKNSGHGEALIIKNVYDIPKIEGIKTFENEPEIAIIGFETLKKYVFSHSEKIQYFWTDYDMAIPTIKELVQNFDLYERYGGKIFAVGVVCSIPKFYNDDIESFHWRTPIYADYDQINMLDNPIDISEFRDYITISRQGTVTPVYADAFDRLKATIINRNKVSEYFVQSSANPLTLSRLTDENWLSVTSEYRRKFVLESQFRAFYVNRFLRELCSKRSIYQECLCHHGVRMLLIVMQNGLMCFGVK